LNHSFLTTRSRALADAPFVAMFAAADLLFGRVGQMLWLTICS